MYAQATRCSQNDATFWAHNPASVVLADGIVAAVFAIVPLPLVLADGIAAAVFARAPLSLVLADTTAAAVFALCPHSLVLADAAAATVFALAPLPLVLTEDRGLAGLLGCRRMWHRSYGNARCIGWVHTSLFVLATLSLWPSCVPLQHVLLARRMSLWAISVI